MASNKKINPFSKQNNDTGFAANSNDVGGRFINKDGSYNLVKEGMPFRKRFSVFHDMLNLPLWKFITVIFLFYIAVNVFFTLVYLLIGYQQLDGLVPGSKWKIVREVFYFSTQTFTTVGYGHVSPVGDGVNNCGSSRSVDGLFVSCDRHGPYLRSFFKTQELPHF